MTTEIEELEPTELKRRIDSGNAPAILDVREPAETAIAAIAGAVEIPMGEIPARIGELERGAEWVVV